MEECTRDCVLTKEEREAFDGTPAGTLLDRFREALIKEMLCAESSASWSKLAEKASLTESVYDSLIAEIRRLQDCEGKMSRDMK